MIEQNIKSPRVVIFPAPAQGHVNSMLKLAELLALRGLAVTFLNTEHVDSLLRAHSDVHARLPRRYPGFLFQTIPDGLPQDHPRSGPRVIEVVQSMPDTKPALKERLSSGEQGCVSCIIADGILGDFTSDAAEELGIPVIRFRTISACSFWAYFCARNLINTGELPIKGEQDLDRLIHGVAGMEGFLRCRDLPSFCRASDVATKVILSSAIHQTMQSTRAYGIILNTFEDLEAPTISHIRTECPNIYSIGPLNAHLNARLADAGSPSSHSTSSLFDVDTTSIVWLDAQPPKSVIYVSFGSLAIVTKENLLEFWHGLVNCKNRFLWVIRPDILADEEDGDRQVLDKLKAATKERGFVASWVPQEEVLSHQAVGGFLTHSGWNSTLESIVAGVPMLCWPYFGDQQMNSRYVGEVWKLGIDMKDVCDREVVAKMICDLMVEKKEELGRSTAKMAKLAKKSVGEGGSSYCNLDRLVEDITVMSKSIDPSSFMM